MFTPDYSRSSLDAILKVHLGIINETTACAWMAHHGGLLVVTDFDGCLTVKNLDGNVTSLMEIVRANLKTDDPATHLLLQRLLEISRVIRTNVQLENNLRCRLLEKNWHAKLTVLAESSTMTPAYLEYLCESPQIQVRADVARWLRTLQNHDAKIVIYSASALGLNLIPLLLRRAGIDPDWQIKIISNGLTWIGERPQVLDTPTVTPLNKTGELVTWIVGKLPSHCLLIGDNIDDLRLKEGLMCPFKRTIGIAGGQEMDLYSRYFDYAVRADASWQEVFPD